MKKPIQVITTRYSDLLCKNNPEYLFVFGDNTLRVGKGGQACVRDCYNTIGISTKKSPSEFFTDADYFSNQLIILHDIIKVKEKLQLPEFKTLVFPIAGLGWGLAAMQKYCPKTALYLSQRLLKEFGFNNLENLVNHD